MYDDCVLGRATEKRTEIGESPSRDEDSRLAAGDLDQEVSAMVREQLDKVMSSLMFDASERNRRFLRYIVEETLANRGVRIKGYSIGISVFDREPSFDPQIDPVVRIEAGRLRRSLERFYLTDGRSAAVRISIPKGGYVPRFEFVMGAMAAARVAEKAPQRRSGLRRAVVVLPFVSLSGDEIGRRFAAALTEEVILEFGKHREFTVFALPPVMVSVGDDTSPAMKTIGARLVLGGSVRIVGTKLRVITRLGDQIDNRHVWSASYDRRLRRPPLTDLERDIAHKVCRAVALRSPIGSLAIEALDLAQAPFRIAPNTATCE